MNIVQITPGAGGMYCGNCFRDNALVAELRRQGHQTLMVPLYLPMTLDEADQSVGTPIFFNGVRVYLEQKSPFIRNGPAWLHDLIASPTLLKWAAGKAAKTRAEDVGDLTLSMLRGEEGNQARELDELIAWLKTQPKPDVICLSNAMLAGLVRKLKRELGAPVAVMLQGEDYFLDSLAEPPRAAVWQTLAERVAEADLLIAPTRYFADVMTKRLRLPPEKVKVIFNGINLDGYEIEKSEFKIQTPPVLGYFARMCEEKGLDTLVTAYLLLRKRDNVKGLKLRIGGGCGPGDELFVEDLRERLHEAGVERDVEFHPNLDRDAKLAFLRSLTMFSVPAMYGEAFGLYVIEAMAAGVPVVQPRTASFPELIDATGGGMVCEPGDAASLAVTIEQLLCTPVLLRAFCDSGKKAVREKFSVLRMTSDLIAAFQSIATRRA